MSTPEVPFNPPKVTEKPFTNGIKGLENLDLVKGSSEKTPEGNLSPKVRRSIERKILNRQTKIETIVREIAGASTPLILSSLITDEKGLELLRKLLGEQRDIAQKESLGNIDYTPFQRKIEELERISKELLPKLLKKEPIDARQLAGELKRVLIPSVAEVIPETETAKTERMAVEILGALERGQVVVDPAAVGATPRTAVEKVPEADVSSREKQTESKEARVLGWDEIVRDLEGVEKVEGADGKDVAGTHIAMNIRKLVGSRFQMEGFQQLPATTRKSEIEREVKELTSNKKLQGALFKAFEAKGWMPKESVRPEKKEPVVGGNKEQGSATLSNQEKKRRAFRAADQLGKAVDDIPVGILSSKHLPPENELAPFMKGFRSPASPRVQASAEERRAAPSESSPTPEAVGSFEEKLEAILDKVKNTPEFERGHGDKKEQIDGKTIAKGVRRLVRDFQSEEFRRLSKVRQIQEINDSINLISTNENLRQDLKDLFGVLEPAKERKSPPIAEGERMREGKEPAERLPTTTPEQRKGNEERLDEAFTDYLGGVKDCTELLDKIMAMPTSAELRRVMSVSKLHTLSDELYAKALVFSVEFEGGKEGKTAKELTELGKTLISSQEIPLVFQRPMKAIVHESVLKALRQSLATPVAKGVPDATQPVVPPEQKPMSRAEAYLADLARMKAEKAEKETENSKEAKDEDAWERTKRMFGSFFMAKEAQTPAPETRPSSTVGDTADAPHKPEAGSEEGKPTDEESASLNKPKVRKLATLGQDRTFSVGEDGSAEIVGTNKPTIKFVDIPNEGKMTTATEEASLSAETSPLRPHTPESAMPTEKVGEFKVGDRAVWVVAGVDAWAEPREITSITHRGIGSSRRSTAIFGSYLHKVPFEELRKVVSPTPEGGTKGGTSAEPREAVSTEVATESGKERVAAEPKELAVETPWTPERIDALTFKELQDLGEEDLDFPTVFAKFTSAYKSGHELGELMQNAPRDLIESVRLMVPEMYKRSFDSGLTALSSEERLPGLKESLLESAKQVLKERLFPKEEEAEGITPAAGVGVGERSENSAEGVRSRVADAFLTFCNEAKPAYGLDALRVQLQRTVPGAEVSVVFHPTSAEETYWLDERKGSCLKCFFVTIGTEHYLLPFPNSPTEFDMINDVFPGLRGGPDSLTTGFQPVEAVRNGKRWEIKGEQVSTRTEHIMKSAESLPLSERIGNSFTTFCRKGGEFSVLAFKDQLKADLGDVQFNVRDIFRFGGDAEGNLYWTDERAASPQCYWAVTIAGTNYLFPKPLNSARFDDGNIPRGFDSAGSVTPGSLTKLTPAILKGSPTRWEIEVRGSLS